MIELIKWSSAETIIVDYCFVDGSGDFAAYLHLTFLFNQLLKSYGEIFNFMFVTFFWFVQFMSLQVFYVFSIVKFFFQIYFHDCN